MGAASSVRDAKLDDAAWFSAFDAKHPVTWDEKETSDRFAKEIYACMPKTAALRDVMENATGFEAYVKFLRTDYADDNVWFYAAVEDIRSGKPVDSSALSADLKAIVNGYITPESPANVELPIETKEAISLLTKGSATDKEILLTLLEAQDEALRILATGAFPKFLKSELCDEWRAKEKDDAATAAAAPGAETLDDEQEPTAAARESHYSKVPPASVQALMHEVRSAVTAATAAAATTADADDDDADAAPGYGAAR